MTEGTTQTTTDLTKEERDCWGTSERVLSLVRKALNGIEVDPTAKPGGKIGEIFNFTKKDDCLTRHWGFTIAPMTVFMNPPYSNPHVYLQKLTQQYLEGRVSAAIALLKAGCIHNAKTGQLIRLYASGYCAWGAGLNKRMGFIHPYDGYKGGANFDVVLVHFGDDESWNEFAQVFYSQGTICKIL